LVREITKVSCHNTADVAIGKMDFYIHDDGSGPVLNSVPTFTTEPPRLGSPVVTYAYPESTPQYVKGMGGGEFRPLYYAGELLDHSEEARDARVISWPHYVTSINVMSGASGGPVFDEHGRVFAINCVSAVSDVSYMARATELLDLTIF